MANVKVVLKQTNKHTDKQTDRAKQYAPQILSGGHKKPEYGHIILSTYTPNADKHVYAVGCLKYYLLGSEIVQINFNFVNTCDRCGHCALK